MQINKWMIMLMLCAVASVQGATDWFDALLLQKATQDAQAEKAQSAPLPDFGTGSFTVTAWLRTQQDGTIVAKTRSEGEWVSGGKSLFIRGGRVTYDIGWVGALRAKSSVTDGKWHHVALTGGKTQKIYVDGRLEGTATMEQKPDPKGSALMIGYTSRNFPDDGDTFEGDIDELCIYGRVLQSTAIGKLYERQRPTEAAAPLAYYPFDGDILDASAGNNQPQEVKRSSFASGRIGQALHLSQGAYLLVPTADSDDHNAALWAKLKAKHRDDTAIQEMDWVREDRIWSTDWRRVSPARAAQRYASLAQRPSSLARDIKRLARAVKGPADLKAVPDQLSQRQRAVPRAVNELEEPMLEVQPGVHQRRHASLPLEPEGEP